MTTRRTFGVLFGAAFLALLSLAAAPAKAAATQIDQPVTGLTATNNCNGEIVNLTSGYVHFSSNVTTNPDGGFHLDVHWNFQNISGVGAMTGANYQVVGSSHESSNTQPGAAFNITFTDYFGVVSQGPLPNEKFQAVFHATVNANGDVTVYMDHFQFTCNG